MAPDVSKPFQMQISALDSNEYVGVIGIGRIKAGKIKPNDPVVIIDSDKEERKGKVLQVMSHRGLERIEVSEADAGDIVCVSGIEKLFISDTLCSPENIYLLTSEN